MPVSGVWTHPAMVGILKRVLFNLFVDKKAKDSLRRQIETKPGAEKPEPQADAARNRPMTPERRRLIREAQEIRREQSKALDELNPEAKAKLMAMALLAMTDEGLGDDE